LTHFSKIRSTSSIGVFNIVWKLAMEQTLVNRLLNDHLLKSVGDYLSLVPNWYLSSHSSSNGTNRVNNVV
jgi:hypothetical protein